MTGAISGYNSYYSYYQNPYTQAAAARTAQAVPSGGRTVTVPAAQTGTPVQPVSPVPGSPAVSSVLDMEDLLRRWETDPAAMAVRGRIQYSDGGTDPSALPGMAAGEAREPAPSGTEPLLSGAEEDAKSAREIMEEGECQTCKNRKYQDGSDDPGVSFKTPSHIDPDNAAAAVRGHEMEHVTREQASASREGREVVSQSVSYHTAICPECGRVYVSGGTTRTVTSAQTEWPDSGEDGEDDPDWTPSLFGA